jgi:anti-anti-sigma factor
MEVDPMATVPWIAAAPLLEFCRRDDGVVAVAGELDGWTGPFLTDYLRGFGPTRLDLRAVSFLDSSGFEALERARQRCHDDGCRFVIESCSPQVERLLRLLGTYDDYLA